jgi:hypothetical protein
MPNCPVCGTEVEATTILCPVCGTDLKQISASLAMGAGASSPDYTHTSRGIERPARTTPHYRRKYALGITVGLVLGLIIGGLITSTFLIGPDVSDVSGVVTLGARLSNPPYNGTAVEISFYNVAIGTLSAPVFAGSYRIYLPFPPGNGYYSVWVGWTDRNSPTLAARPCNLPGGFSSHASRVNENFSCDLVL